MPVRAKGVAGIKTLAAARGCGVHSTERHVQHFQLGSLELERSRRLRERQAALTRIQSLDGRLLEIEALVRQRQEALGATNSDAGREKPANGKRRTLRY